MRQALTPAQEERLIEVEALKRKAERELFRLKAVARGAAQAKNLQEKKYNALVDEFLRLHEMKHGPLKSLG